MKKLCCMMLIAALCVAMLPAGSFAAERAAVQMVSDKNKTGGIAGWSSAEGYDYIYFGSWENGYYVDENNHGYYDPAPLKWRVLDDQTNTGAEGLFLLSEVLLGDDSKEGGVYFSKTATLKWQGSDARAWCSAFAQNAFTALENGAVQNSYKSDGEHMMYDGVGGYCVEEKNALNGDQVFFLSAAEAMNSDYGFANSNKNDGARAASRTGEALWWLRSCSSGYVYFGYVHGNGQLAFLGNSVDSAKKETNAARPALNLDLNDILFASDAELSKANSFGSVIDTTRREWKLTLKDGNSFADGAKVESGETKLPVGYADAQLSISHKKLSDYTNAGYTNVTAALTDAKGNVLYYGSISNDKSAVQSAVTIPAGLKTGTYTLSLYAEQWNENKMTDYATGTPFTVKITVGNPSSGGEVIIGGEAITGSAEQNAAAAQPLPQTGDGSMPALWAALALASLAAAIGLHISRKRRA